MAIDCVSEAYPTKGLIIKDPWIDLILDGEKTWEIRGSNVNHRGLTGLVRSGSKAVFGTAKLVEVIGPIPRSEFDGHFPFHRVDTSRIHIPYAKIYAWVFEDVRRFEAPRAYQHKLGSVIWVSL